MRAASSGLFVPAMGLPDGEGAGDAECTGSGEGGAAVVLTGVLDAWGEAAGEDTARVGTTGDPKTGEVSERRQCRLCLVI